MEIFYVLRTRCEGLRVDPKYLRTYCTFSAYTSFLPFRNPSNTFLPTIFARLGLRRRTARSGRNVQNASDR